MILEAFANYLHSSDPGVPATRVLARWLWERLTFPAQNNVDRVIRYEIILSSDAMCLSPDDLPEPYLIFFGRSDTGERLLKSLCEYAASYEQQKWSRWVHCVKASDFRDRSGKE